MPGLTATQAAEALLYDGFKWPSPVITYSIPTAASSGPTWNGERPEGYGVLNGVQADAFRTAMQSFDRLIAPRLLETDDATAPGDIRVAFMALPGGISGLGNLPPLVGGSTEPFHGDIWFNEQMKSRDFGPTDNTAAIMNFLHEIGHALGLRHPHEGDPPLTKEFDTVRYSVVSYRADARPFFWELVNNPNQPGGVESKVTVIAPTTPMVADIAALQALYGADPETAAGDTSYTWQEGKAFQYAIYDAGGIDTFDLASHARPSFIDLTPGAYSSIDYWSIEAQKQHMLANFPGQLAQQWVADPKAWEHQYDFSNNLGIAFTTTIERVRAGSGGDTVLGNAADNDISGGAGDDLLRGGEGGDFLSGGAGFDDMHGNQGDDILTGEEGPDWVVGGQGRDVLYGGAGDDIVYGNLGDDTGLGQDGADWVRGGQGDDSLLGGAGDDFMSGDRGADTLSGGSGADRFNIVEGCGLDRILDFGAAEGDRLVLETARAYTLAQVGADTVVDLGGGDQVVLAGVTLSTLPVGWLIA